MWFARWASDREIAGFTPVLGVYAIVPLEMVLYADFPGSVVLASSSKLKSDTYNKADKDNTGISESALGNACCSMFNVWRCAMSQEDK